MFRFILGSRIYSLSAVVLAFVILAHVNELFKTTSFEEAYPRGARAEVAEAYNVLGGKIIPVIKVGLNDNAYLKELDSKFINDLPISIAEDVTRKFKKISDHGASAASLNFKGGRYRYCFIVSKSEAELKDRFTYLHELGHCFNFIRDNQDIPSEYYESEGAYADALLSYFPEDRWEKLESPVNALVEKSIRIHKMEVFSDVFSLYHQHVLDKKDFATAADEILKFRSTMKNEMSVIYDSSYAIKYAKTHPVKPGERFIDFYDRIMKGSKPDRLTPKDFMVSVYQKLQ
ncbi:hypothetical protein RGL65_002499 [Vibrio parahaemolyticus]|nr:hypothetical protein [Vibrio parahaemolyticus]ELA8198454.1 hypothetical protein [Vibrio parahaemolyticus]